MTPERLRREDGEHWLRIARSDLSAAGVLITAGLYPETIVHCQPAAEKALKGFLTFHGIPFRKTHDISDFSAACLAVDASLDGPLQRRSSGPRFLGWRGTFQPRGCA
jgi:hypothetical protein